MKAYLGPWAAAAVIATIATVPASAAAPVRGNCSPSKAAYIASSSGSTVNSSGNFAAVPEAVVSFVQGGTKASCVMVFFFGTMGANQTGLYLRAMIDGSSTSVIPDSPQIERNPDVYSTSNSVVYIIPSVAPGTHKIQFQYRSSSAGSPVQIGAHNVVVMHAP